MTWFEPAWIDAILAFVIGPVHKVMGTAALVLLVNIAVDYYMNKNGPKIDETMTDEDKETITKARKHPISTSLVSFFEKVIAYFAFIVIANRIDDLFIDQLFGWDSSTQFLVCLFMVGREMKKIVNYLSQRFGISIPILNDRLNDMTGGQTQATSQWRQPGTESTKDRIKRMRGELQDLEYEESIDDKD